jgi:4'-phosphopantetheinyl transferase
VIAAANRSLSSAICDVYIATTSALRSGHEHLLDASERARAGRYVRAEDRERFILGAALLRLVAAGVSGKPEAVVVDRTCGRCGKPHGKPRIVGSDLETSIAHSGSVAAVAASVDGPVGVDVEARRDLDYGPLLRQVCTEDEQLHVRGLDDFYTYWTRKEAFLKATGTGLMDSMRNVVVTAPGSLPAVLNVSPAPPAPPQLVDIHPYGQTGAVAVLTSLPLRCNVVEAAALLASVVTGR